MTITDIYYFLRPAIPRRLQIALRRTVTSFKRSRSGGVWPIDNAAQKPPDRWAGWPEGKRFALVLTHDVDTATGQNRCRQLMKLEMESGVRSSFNFVPERYKLDHQLRNHLAEMGFEVGVHGLHHDGKLLNSEQIFRQRAVRINRYIEEWQAVGFRAPAMHHNLEWFHALNIEYDASTFDTDPFEPMSDGVSTIFPFIHMDKTGQHGYVELPYTLAQDFTLFVLMQEKNVDIWKRKLDWIAEKGGMALLNTHPDYMSFTEKGIGLEEYPSRYYQEFLDYVLSKYGSQFWLALPRDVARFWRNRTRPTGDRQVPENQNGDPILQAVEKTP